MNLSVSTVAALAREPGIYVLRNTKNGKVYVGASVNPRHLWISHNCHAGVREKGGTADGL